MSFVSALDTALSSLGEHLGLGSLGFDEDGACNIILDEDIEIGILPDPSGEALIIHSRVGATTEQNQSAVLGQLLLGNLFWSETGGATLSWEPQSGQVLLAEKVFGSLLEPERLAEKIAQFANVVETWRNTLDGQPTATEFASEMNLVNVA